MEELLKGRQIRGPLYIKILENGVCSRCDECSEKSKYARVGYTACFVGGSGPLWAIKETMCMCCFVAFASPLHTAGINNASARHRVHELCAAHESDKDEWEESAERMRQAPRWNGKPRGTRGRVGYAVKVPQ